MHLVEIMKTDGAESCPLYQFVANSEDFAKSYISKVEKIVDKYKDFYQNVHMDSDKFAWTYDSDHYDRLGYKYHSVFGRYSEIKFVDK